MVPFWFFPFWINLNDPKNTVSKHAIPTVVLMTNNREILHRFVMDKVKVIKKKDRIEDQKIKRHDSQNER
jgi:hypothetical protein